MGLLIGSGVLETLNTKTCGAGVSTGSELGNTELSFLPCNQEIGLSEYCTHTINELLSSENLENFRFSEAMSLHHIYITLYIFQKTSLTPVKVADILSQVMYIVFS